MKKLIEFPLEDSEETILIEVEEDERVSGMVPAARGDQPGVPEKAAATFQSAMDKMKPIATTIIKKIRSLHDAPDEVEVEFGLKMSAEAGAFVASACVDANYKVVLKWKKEEKKS